MPAPTLPAAKRCCAAARASARARSACWRLAGLPRSTWCDARASPCSRPATNWSSPAGRCARPASTTATARSSPPPIVEAGGEPVPFGAFPTRMWRSNWPMRTALDPATWWCFRAALRRAPATCRTASCRGSARPAFWCTASRSSPASRSASRVIGDKPLIVLPGFPTSAIFTFHAFVAPLIRARAGAPPKRRKPSRRGFRCGSHPSLAARNSCWFRWSPAPTARSRFRAARAPAR